MAQKSKIEWTDATWNPVTGCSKIGPGCDNCYAERIAERFRGVPGHPYELGFDLTLRPERLLQPIRWHRPRMIFVNSMSDLFHKQIPTDFVNEVFNTMETADHHVYQVLTKRSSRLTSYVNRRYPTNPAPKHIWFGVSVEDKLRSSRIAHLRNANASIRFVSIEPLLARLGRIDLTEIDWVILGGESGPRARPMDISWVREIRDQCLQQDVSFFFKQWGGRTSKAGGRLLDGVSYDGFPKGFSTSISCVE